MTVNKCFITISFHQYYFLMGILIALTLAELFPTFGSYEGPLPKWLRHMVVFCIFFISGFNLQWKQLLRSIYFARVHAFVQCFIFIFAPIFTLGFVYTFVVPLGLDKWIVVGIIGVSCMPPPVTTTVAFTKIANGNESLAILNCTLSNILGVLATPLLFLFHVGVSTPLSMSITLFTLVWTVIVPLLLGKMVQRFSGEKMASCTMTKVSELALFFTIYTTFCDIFMQKEFNNDAKNVLIVLLVVIIIQALLTYLCMFFALKCKFHPEDVVAIAFCSSHKSLAMGLFLLKTLFGGLAHLPQISLGLLLYYPVQLILGGLLVPFAQQWINNYSPSTRICNTISA